ncbi:MULTISPECIES: DUF397 domain-containing protein [unclassified Saccharopolyspora]|uniref:DUF397 domain-containing protein n=1 Tax=unclassified Saccharopolyspora TaxID=2646250 RepID=UPI001CD31B79|nr:MULTISPECIES: DUF397 domain-containing protein [unclassified Saccharopolyspora]MCA1185112.1 DUF397 domain-containing protein [Saccharopolyspora sp. 6T]MCA1191412.1 DUF397 domain-containing protein [Saccharopolyspora sp. 6V]MCA1224987.1 DUF397 domain-containing protein [Saccharopolyspora sp. 6M]MCA1278522.1 DUF397 domain-containing protein [Saccharopolyspora sp. 7B]
MSTPAEWRKSSRSGQANNCVEVATNVPGGALVRDSKLGDASPVLETTPTAMVAFLSAIRSGRFDG